MVRVVAVGPPDPFLNRVIVDALDKARAYQLIQKLGSGGMGSVYRATDTTTGGTVALKILHPRLTSRKDLSSRFRREAQAMSRLTHENTVRVLHYGTSREGSLFIVMELVEGRNLNSVIRRGGPMATPRAVGLMVRLCGALEEAHGLGIVHRDLKPENILVCDEGTARESVKILDFGLAKITDQSPGATILTQEGMVFGTPEFMSPEQAQGLPLDGRSDLYSLAVILFEMLTGKLPFLVNSPIEYIQKHIAAPPRRLAEAAPHLSFSEALEVVVARALSKQPDQRYASALSFGEALRAALDVPGMAVPRDTGAVASSGEAGGIRTPVGAVVALVLFGLVATLLVAGAILWSMM